MKYSMVGIAMLAITAGAGPSQAQVAYSKAALLGCYGYLATSVDTETPPENQNVVGTLCFDGAGHVVGIPATPALSGNDSNLNGALATSADVHGTYNITNTPGDGMGTWNIGQCFVHAFSINTVDANNLAHGFTFALIRRVVGTNCTGPEVIGGTAYYQGPLTKG